jgi:hypothetical protein
MSQQGGDLKETMFEGAVAYGRIKATIMLIVGILITLGMLYFGFKLRNSVDVFSGNVQAYVVKPDCKSNITIVNNRTSTNISCILDIKYTIDGKEYTGQINTGGKIYNVNEPVGIRYDPSNPANITTNLPNKTMGNYLIIGSFVVLLLSFITWFIAYKSKVGAALVTVGDTRDVLFGSRY